MTDIIMIPLSKLVEGKSNARRTDRSQSIGELAASIEAHGLLQSLVVADCGNGRYSVEAGGRRLKALRKLAKRKSLASNQPIPCRIVPAEAAAEASLAENVVRVPMHPVDEILAMAALCDAGEGPEAIAVRNPSAFSFDAHAEAVRRSSCAGGEFVRRVLPLCTPAMDAATAA